MKSNPRSVVPRLLSLVFLVPSVLAQRGTTASPTTPIVTPPPTTASVGFGNSSCSARCDLTFPSISNFYTWSPISYAASTTIEVTVATLILFVDDATNQTSTSTQLVESTVTEGLPIPSTTAVSTLTLFLGESDTITTAVTYPSALFDYGSAYTIESGHFSTDGKCTTVESQEYTPSSSVPFPIPTSLAPQTKGDRFGQDHTLVFVPPDDNLTKAFDAFYAKAYSDQGGLRSCTLPLPSATFAVTSNPSPAASSESASAITHTSVALLTARVTSHVNSIPIGGNGPHTALPQTQPSTGGNSQTTGTGGAGGNPHAGGSPSGGGGSSSGGRGSSNGGGGSSGSSGGSTGSSSSGGGSSSGGTGESGSGGGNNNSGGSNGNSGDAIAGAIASAVGKGSPSATNGAGGQSGNGGSGSSGNSGQGGSGSGAPAIVFGGFSVPFTPTSVATTIDGTATTVPAVIANSHTIAVGGAPDSIDGIGVELTVVGSGSAKTTEVVIGSGSGPSGAHTTLPITFPSTTTEPSAGGTGSAILSGLNGPGGNSPTSGASGAFTGAAPLAATGLRNVLEFVVFAAAGMMI